MSSLITSSQRLFIERTLRVLGHGTLALILVAFLWGSWKVYSRQPLFTIEQIQAAGTPWGEPLSETRTSRTVRKLRDTASEIAVSTPLFLLPASFYWLAHFLRLGREEASK